MNKFRTTVAGAFMLCTLAGCDTRDPIELKKESIIRSMNEILKKEEIVIPHGSKCTILVLGDKINNQLSVALTCTDGTLITRTYPRSPIEQYTTIIDNLSPNSVGNLSTEGSCLRMKSEDPNGNERYITSFGCSLNT